MIWKKLFLLIFVFGAIYFNADSQSDSWLQKGQNAMKKKNFKEAVNFYTKAIQIDSSVINAFYNRGLAFLYLDNFENALNDFNYVISKDSNNADVFNNRGLAYGFLGKGYESINDFNKAIQLDSTFSTAYFNRGNAFMNLNNDNKALADFNKSIEIDSSNPAVFFQRGTIYYSKANYSRALNDFNKAISMGYRTSKIYYNLGNAYFKLNNLENAVKYYNDCLKLDSNDFDALNNRAVAFDKLGLKEKAEKDRKKLQKIRGINLPKVESLKFTKFSSDRNYFTISLPENWKKAISDSGDVIEMNISPEPIKVVKDPYYVGVHLSLNLNMDKHWGKSTPDDLIEFWKGSVGINIKEYFGYNKYTEKYFTRFGYQGIMTQIQVQFNAKSVPLMMYEYALAKDNVLFFAYFQSPSSDFEYYQKIFDKAIETLFLKETFD